MRQHERQPQGGFARGAGEDDLVCAKKVLAGQKIVQQKRGDQKRAQKHLQSFMLGPVGRISSGEQILIVCQCEMLPVFGCIHKTALAHLARFDQQLVGHGQVAIHAGAGFDVRMPGGCYVSKAPDRYLTPGCLRWEEVPISEAFAQGRIGNVVGGEGKVVDRQQCLTFTQLIRSDCRRFQCGALIEIVLVHYKGSVACGHGKSSLC